MASPGKEAAVTKESKLALIIGFVLVLVVGVLVSDHFSQANKMSIENLARGGEITRTPITSLGTREAQGIDSAFGDIAEQARSNRNESRDQPPPMTIDNTNPASGSILDEAIRTARNTIEQTEFPVAAETRQKPATESRRPAVPNYQTYTVVSGDTLIGIARRYLGDAERYRDIESLNADQLGPDLVLAVGMKLKLPNDAKIITLEDRGTSSVEQRSGDRVYTVRSGDTLGEIAYKLLGTSKRMNEIVELNGLDSADTIYVGMTLKVPAE
jgi:nucleoid-associated protein YgaU